ncbi:MAG: MoaD/ThiS family protein [Candidatus Bathyarchaeota archaeon]|nr:MAG: MoaD/ThiS family protein [Candidatus Bathyarchaeota archaeon]
MTVVNIEFVGVLQTLAGKRIIALDICSSGSSLKVKDVVRRLTEQLPHTFSQSLIDPELQNPKPNALILVNNQEISALNDMNTEIQENDHVVFIPVSHGG